MRRDEIEAWGHEKLKTVMMKGNSEAQNVQRGGDNLLIWMCKTGQTNARESHHSWIFCRDLMQERRGMVFSFFFFFFFFLCFLLFWFVCLPWVWFGMIMCVYVCMYVRHQCIWAIMYVCMHVSMYLYALLYVCILYVVICMYICHMCWEWFFSFSRSSSFSSTC